MRGKIVGTGAGTKYYVDGKEVTESEFWEAFPEQPMDSGDFGAPISARAWPMLSDALAVHPRQVEEAQESAARKGVPTEFAPDGRAILKSREHRRQYLRAYGYRDNNGGYGDG